MPVPVPAVAPPAFRTHGFVRGGGGGGGPAPPRRHQGRLYSPAPPRRAGSGGSEPRRGWERGAPRGRGSSGGEAAAAAAAAAPTNKQTRPPARAAAPGQPAANRQIQPGTRRSSRGADVTRLPVPAPPRRGAGTRGGHAPCPAPGSGAAREGRGPAAREHVRPAVPSGRWGGCHYTLGTTVKRVLCTPPGGHRVPHWGDVTVHRGPCIPRGSLHTGDHRKAGPVHPTRGSPSIPTAVTLPGPPMARLPG